MTVRALFTVVLASILTMVLSGAVSAQAPFPKVCNYVQGRVPAAMISDAVAIPTASVAGANSRILGNRRVRITDQARG